MSEEALHLPVMAREVEEFLNPQAGGCFLDGTLGLAGHSVLIAQKIGSSGRLIALDKDQKALALARKKLSTFTGKVDLVHSDFRDFDVVLKKLGVDAVDGMLFDLGISSFQLDAPERGFSFRSEGPLDMRMNQDALTSAADIINTLQEEELANVIFTFGEERFSRRIAKAIVQYRARKKIETTKELEEIIFTSVPVSYRRQKIHPATRTFQAIRIAVNRELESLQLIMDKCADYLKEGGRIGVISFHSLEDRIVKEKFKSLAKSGIMTLIVKKPLRPSDDEIKSNPRARSARFRVAERTTCN
ncbi:MAG: 16S rRNA (cytosine(1402)-N(4))-methyltransferase RsmH [Candidatus Omnitrophica bacterium]|nr:16S rRNA (cytosine(1402)-N(4))-methyltransferase RsmH [Candidatus Omnitrophota bacterium]